MLELTSSRPPTRVRDRPSPTSNLGPLTPETPRLTEAVLFRLWAGQRFPESALVTSTGVPLRVLQPGRPGRGPGPDFRDAIVAPPSGPLLRGDVELHVRAADFRGHGHATDHRYDRLALHVVFDACGQQETRLSCGRSVPIVALSAWVTRRERELSGWLERPGLWREPCHDAAARIGRDAVLELLDNLGSQRLVEREETLAGTIEAHGAGEALYRALLEGTGYGGGAAALAGVAAALPYAELSRRLDAVKGNERRNLLAAQLLMYAQSSEQAITRPANRPARRLAGLACLLVRHHPLGHHTPDLASGASGLIRSWSAPPEIGRSRAIELLTNAVLPWAAALSESAGLAERARQTRQTVAALPRPARYGGLGFLEANLRDGGQPLPISSLRQQGLLALYKSECTSGGCGRCALS